MIGDHESRVFTENATSVRMEWVAGNAAGNRSALVDLIHHVLLTGQSTVLINLVNTVLLWNVASFTRVAVSAHFHGGALLTIGPAFGLVDGASLICDFIPGHPPKGSKWVTTTAAQRGVHARDEHLWCDIDIGPGGASRNFDTV